MPARAGRDGPHADAFVVHRPGSENVEAHRASATLRAARSQGGALTVIETTTQTAVKDGVPDELQSPDAACRPGQAAPGQAGPGPDEAAGQAMLNAPGTYGWTRSLLHTAAEPAARRERLRQAATLAQDPLDTLLPGLQPLPGSTPREVLARTRRAFGRYRLLLLLSLLAGLGVAAWRIAHRPLYYQATASIELHRRIFGRRVKLDDASENGVQARSGELYALRNDLLLGQVAEELGLLTPLNPALAPRGEAGRAERVARARTLARLRAGLRITADGTTNLVRVRYSSTDPRFAADLVNRLVDDFVDGLYRRRLYASDRVVNWQLGQLTSLKNEAEQSEQRMLRLQRELGLPGFNTRFNHFEEVLKSMQEQVDTATITRIGAEARYRALHGAALAQLQAPAGVLPARVRDNLRQAQAQAGEIGQEIARLETSLGARHPRVLALRAQQAVLESRRDHIASGIVEEAAGEATAARLAEQETRRTLDAEQRMVDALSHKNAEFIAAQRAFLELRSLYTQEYLRLRGSGFTNGLKEAPVEIIDRAYTPAAGEREAVWRILLLWLSCGLAAGMTAALALANLRGGLRSLGDAEQMLELPGLVSLPAAPPTPGAGPPPLAVLLDPHGPFTAALHLLASTLVLRDADLADSAEAGIGFGPDKLLLFTSATPSEGKTTVACNVAVALAQRGRRVLLIDADLRRPAVHHRLGLSGRFGLSTVLAGKLPLADALQHVEGLAHLDVLGSGPIPPVSSALVESVEFARLLERAAGEYTHVIVDSPPVLAVADAVVLARLVDAVLLVVRYGKVGPAVVRRARDVLSFANAPLLGVVLNAVPQEQPRRARAARPAPQPAAL